MATIRRSDSRLSILFELSAAATAARELVARAMAGSPLTPEEYAVYSVLFDEGPHGPTELARRTGMPPTSMSHFVRAMLERGHARRAPSEADRRSYRIVLTAAGLDAHGEAARFFAEADRRFARALAIDDEAARATLRAMGAAAREAQAGLAEERVDALA
ncbi:MAG TPA: MarR family transcriptional regulator [Candidatus Limnocylindrales bacterium]|jgi:DNA-binding MarR family transcriptional regulator